MKIFKISIPIKDIYGDGVFFMEYFVNYNFWPKKGEIVELIKSLHQQEFHVLGYCGEHEKALESIDLMKDWPSGSESMVISSKPVPDFGVGLHPLSITKVELHDFTKFNIKKKE